MGWSSELIPMVGRPDIAKALVDVSAQTAWALGMIDDASALEVLLDAMTDDDLDVRPKARWALGQIYG